MTDDSPVIWKRAVRDRSAMKNEKRSLDRFGKKTSFLCLFDKRALLALLVRTPRLGIASLLFQKTAYKFANKLAKHCKTLKNGNFERVGPNTIKPAAFFFNFDQLISRTSVRHCCRTIVESTRLL